MDEAGDNRRDDEVLGARLREASGSDDDLDRAVAVSFAVSDGDYTASTERARDLVAKALPDWRLHVGFNASGVMPYAALSRDGRHVEAAAPTLPLAILRAAWSARFENGNEG